MSARSYSIWLRFALVLALLGPGGRLARADEPETVGPATVAVAEIEGQVVPYELTVGGGRNRHTYSLLPGPATDEQRALYEALSPEDRQAFQKKRLTTLRLIAGALNPISRTWGAGAAARQSLAQIPVLGRLFGSRESGEGTPATLRERGRQSIQHLLLAVDNELFSRAPIVARANEYGISLSAGVGAGAMINRTGIGEGHSLGFYVGFDSSARRAILELYYSRERVTRATVALRAPTLTYSVAVRATARPEGDKAEIGRGRGHYPFVVPGVGRVFAHDGPNSVSAGLAGGVSIIPGGETLAQLTQLPELGTGLDAWRVESTRVPLVRADVTMPEGLSSLSVRFQTAVNFRAGAKWLGKVAGAIFYGLPAKVGAAVSGAGRAVGDFCRRAWGALAGVRRREEPG